MRNETQDFAGMADVEQGPDPAPAPATETVPEALEAPRARRWDLVRDACAAVLLVLALLVPWNVSLGLGVPSHTWWLYAVMIGATIFALIALAASHGGPLSKSEAVDKVRLGLTAPYLLVLVGFAGFAVYDFVVLSGGGTSPSGVGPGVLVGAAGAFLAAQPVLASGDDHRRFVGWFVLASRVASWVKFFVTVSVLLTLYLRTRDVLPNVFDSSIAWPSIATVLTAVAYGAVAMTAVWIGLRWMQQEEMDAGLATIALGAATLVGSLLVWLLPFGRDIDAFHGIAQATSTAGVGYEGYLAWAVGAAIFAPPVLWQAATRPVQASVWHEAIRKCLLLIAVWCAASAVLRIFDLIVEMAGGVPLSLSDAMVLFVFDLAAAGLAYWLRANVVAMQDYSAVISRLSGVLAVLLVCRVVLGGGLARPIQYAAQPDVDGAVYGNTLARQLTSTFDVVLFLLAVAVLAVGVFVLRRRGSRDPEQKQEESDESDESSSAETTSASAGRHRHRQRSGRATPRSRSRGIAGSGGESVLGPMVDGDTRVVLSARIAWNAGNHSRGVENTTLTSISRIGRKAGVPAKTVPARTRRCGGSQRQCVSVRGRTLGPCNRGWWTWRLIGSGSSSASKRTAMSQRAVGSGSRAMSWSRRPTTSGTASGRWGCRR